MFGRREGAEIRLKAKSRHGLMSVVIFDHQEVSNKAKSFVASIANAAISLANWSTNEENAAIHDTCGKMYELSMLLSAVIELFSKEYSAMAESLKELLRQEMNLDVLNKKVSQAEMKATKLKKQNIEKEKNLANLGNAELEFEELNASFDAQNTKHEILKVQCLRDSINRLADGTISFAKNVSMIGDAEKKIANVIPIVPTHMSSMKKYEGEGVTEELIIQTAEALNIARPMSFMELLAKKRARVRKLKVKSCFLPQSNDASSPEEMEWNLVEHSLSTSLVDLSRDDAGNTDERRFNPEMFSDIKERLHVGNTNGRSYISNPAIERRLAHRARGLNAGDDGLQPPISPPTSPPPRSPARKAPKLPVDLPRVEPYAVSRWKPDQVGLYAQTDLFCSGVNRFPRSWEGDENRNRRETRDSGEYTKPRDFSQSENENEAVYAVLEQGEVNATADGRYIDVVE